MCLRATFPFGFEDGIGDWIVVVPDHCLSITCTVDSSYLDFGYLEQPLVSKKKSGPCLNIEI